MNDPLLHPIMTRTCNLLRVEFLDAARDVTRRLAAGREMALLNQDSFDFIPDDYLVALAGQIKRRELAGLDVVSNSGQLLATVMFRNNDSTVEYLWCEPDLRRQGIGAALLRRASDTFKERGAGEAETWIGESNLVAQNFFASHGWRPTNMVVGESADYRRYVYNYG